MAPLQQQQFTLAGYSSNVTWRVEPAGSGTITSTGLYTAPANGAIAFITAVPASTGSTYIAVVYLAAGFSSSVASGPTGPVTPPAPVTPPPTPISVSLEPASTYLHPGQSVTLSAAVQGTPNQQVQWSLSPNVGTIVNGLYTAPSSYAGQEQQVTISATSLANLSSMATATVLLGPPLTTTPPVTGVTIGITPATMTLSPGQSAQFTAAVKGTTNTAVSWSLTPNMGSVVNGFYIAPANTTSKQTVTLTAVSAAEPSVSASVPLILQPVSTPATVSVSLSPGTASLTGGQSATFVPTVSGNSNQGVTWSLNPQVGTITNGVYQAPAIIASKQTVTVTATSAANSAQTASATVSLQPVGVTVGPASASLGAGQSATFTASVTGSTNTAVTWSMVPVVGTLVGGVYTAPATISTAQTVTLTAASAADSTKTATAAISLTPAPSNLPNTPHFGNDGSQLTSYVPGKSMFVRSMFFSGVSDLPQYVNAFKAAKLNTLESGFYVDPLNNFSSAAAWQSYFNGYVSPIETAANVDGFNIILTGDDIARGSTAVYDAVSGPSTAWSPDPITYAFTWAKNLGKVIGVEMVDEITSQFGAPFPQGQLGQPGGPQQISCVNNLCTVTWPSQVVIQNGAEMFLITGATSNANLNRPVTNLYHQNAGFNNGFTFNATSVGTQTFTAATDPNLIMQMFAAVPEPQSTAGATGYIHNNAISQIMSYINAVPGRPSVTWPAGSDAPPANFGAWAGPGAADYGDIYFNYATCSNPAGCQPSDGLYAFNNAWPAKYPFAQPNKPVLMEASDYGLSYNIVGTSIPVASFNGNTVTFSQPHGIVTAVVGTTRLSVSGNSNSSLNGNYYVYNVVNPTTVQVYPANSTGPEVQGGKITFFDGQTVNLSVVPTTGYIASSGFNMDGGPYCPDSDNFGQVATVSNSSYAAYDGSWYVFPIRFDGSAGSGTCTWSVEMTPLNIVQPGTGGTASVIADNYYHPGISTQVATGASPDLTAANVMYAAEMGAAGVRVYMFGDDANLNPSLNTCFANCSTHVDPNPLYNGPTAQATWGGLSNAFNLIDQIEPYLLQPQLPSPNYGPTMVTAARTSSYGTLLLMTEFADSSQVVNINLSAYNPSGGPGTMYTMTGEELNQQSISGTSTEVTFAPGETVAFTFPAAQ
jgi:hypothetical protein